MHFSVFGLLLGLFNGMRALAEKCDNRYCYNIVGQVLMNNTKEILDICQSKSPPSQLLSIFDSEVQKSVDNFFVYDLTAFGGETSTYIVLALQKNANGEWIWISTSTSASQSFQNWQEGNPIPFQGGDCAFFTPQESSKWWNSLCSSKIVTVICMRVQYSQTFTTISPQTPRLTRDQTTTTAKLTQPNVGTPVISTLTTTTTLIPTTTTTSTKSTTISPTITTTTTSTTTTTPATSTTTTTTTSISPATSTFTTTSTASTTTTVPTTTNGSLTQPSTATSSGPSGEEISRRNLGIGFGVTLSLVIIICLIVILVTHFFMKKNRKNSNFSTVTDIDHVKHYMAQSPQVIPPDVVSDLGNADRRSSDSDFDNEDTKTKTVEQVENVDTHSELNDDVEVERPESTYSVHSVWPIDTSTESDLDVPEESRFDWDYTTNTGASKKSLKKVSFDLEHVVEIPN